MKHKISAIIPGLVLAPLNVAFAGDFYKLHPFWMEYIYHLVLLTLIIVGLIISYIIFRNLKGGKLGKAWIMLFLSLLVITVRTVLGVLTVFDVAYFEAEVFAGLDVLFYIMLLISLILYKVGLE